MSLSNASPSLPSRKFALDRRAIDTFGCLMVAGIWLERQISVTSKSLTSRISYSALPKPVARTPGLGPLILNRSHQAHRRGAPGALGPSKR
jgi:hypothetical protein